MKLKQYLAGSLLALMTLATSCTSEELVSTGNGSTEELPEGAVQFSIDGINTGAVESRAIGGTAVASAQENQVNNLTILVFGSQTAGDIDANLTFQDYWTSNKRADYTCDTENKTFALKGMGKFYTATIVVPVTLKTTKYIFLTNEPRVFNVSSYLTAPTGASYTFAEQLKMYEKEGDHLHVGYALSGKSYEAALQMLGMADGLNGVGVPATYGAAVPTVLPCDKLPFEMANDYFGFVPGKREALSMTGVSSVNAGVVDGQAMDVTLYRNVARLDVSNDNVSVKSLKLTNISTMGSIGNNQLTAIPLQLGVAATTVQSTYSLTVTAADGTVSIPARSYCYPSMVGAEVKLVGELSNGTTFEIPFVDKDTKLPLTVQSNHRYIISLRQTSDNNIDANIIVKDWAVGEVLDVDLSGGDNIVPAPVLYDGSNDALITWESTGKAVAMVGTNYSFNSTNPATYPWLRFDLLQMSSLGMKLYYKDQETNYPGAFFDPAMQVYKTTESELANGLRNVRHELMITQPGTSTQWLKLQNNFNPSLNYVVKIETGNMEVTGTGMRTPALIAFAETNAASADKLIPFPVGGFDGPYSTPVANWTAYRGITYSSIAGYGTPEANQLQNISPDKGWGVFAYYNGVNVKKTLFDASTTVLYSGSKLDHNVVRVIVDRRQTGENLGTAAPYVNLEATLWHYDVKGYLKISQVNVSVPGSDAGALSSYTALMDIFNNKQSGSTGITRYFPASDAAETAYTGVGNSALVFNATSVRFVEKDYAGGGTVYRRPVIKNGKMTIPTYTPIAIAELAPIYSNGQPSIILDFGAGTTPAYVAPIDNTFDNGHGGTTDLVLGNANFDEHCPAGWRVPTLDDIVGICGVTDLPPSTMIQYPVASNKLLVAWPMRTYWTNTYVAGDPTRKWVFQTHDVYGKAEISFVKQLVNTQKAASRCIQIKP